MNWVVDPDVLDSAYQLGNSYTPLGGTVTDGGAATGTWLADVKDAIKGAAGCYTLPYTDPDLVSLAHTPPAGPICWPGRDAEPAGRGRRLRHTQDAGLARRRRGRHGDGRPHRQAARGDGGVSSSDYKVYDSDSAATVPTRAVVDGKVQAVVSDSLLPSVFAPAANDDGLSDPGVLAGQKWLAQMAFLLRDNVADRSTVVAAPPRDFDPTRSWWTRSAPPNSGSASPHWTASSRARTRRRSPPART